MFCSVSICGALVVSTSWLGNERLAGVSVTTGASIPVPIKEIDCGLEGALSVNVIAPETVPATVGVNVTLTLQLPPAATLAPQVLL